jgi:hypothetical protein
LELIYLQVKLLYLEVELLWLRLITIVRVPVPLSKKRPVKV